MYLNDINFNFYYNNLDSANDTFKGLTVRIVHGSGIDSQDLTEAQFGVAKVMPW